MDKIELDGVFKEHIYKYLQENIRAYKGHEEEFEKFKRSGALDKDTAIKVLGDLICSSKLTKIYLSDTMPREEFRDKIESANKIFDSIPKGKDYEEDSYAINMDTGIYDNMDAKTIQEYLQTGIRLDEFYKKVYLVQNLREVAESTIESIKSIDDNEIEISEENKTNINNISEELSELLGKPNTDVKKIQMCIESYNKEAVGIWKTYLSDGKGVLVHNITKGPFEGDYNKTYMSTSLITSKTMALFGEGDGNNYGLIIKPQNIIGASPTDTWTKNEPANSYENVFLKKNSMKLPWEIEKNCIDRTIEASGEMLNYDNGPCFSEIVADGYEIESMYYRSNGEGELAPNYETAKKMAEERGVELIELDISKAREGQGLEPMTEGMQKNFFANILRKQFLSEEQIREARLSWSGQFKSSFDVSKEKLITDKYYKDFYNKYLELRSSGNYGKEEMLKEFHSMISEKEMIEMKDYYDEKTGVNKEDKTEFTEEEVETIESVEEEYKEPNSTTKRMTFIESIKNLIQLRRILDKIKSVFNKKSKMLPEAENQRTVEKLDDGGIKAWDLSNWGIDKQQFMREHAEYMEEYSDRQQAQQTIEQPSSEPELTEL